MKLLATFKHISSKNADYGAAEAYLTFEHDEFTMKPTLDENGRLVPREGYRLATLNCGEEDFAVACLRSNLRYGKNQKREDVKSHHYIISFDPRDGTDNGLTVDKAQSLGEEFCNEHFPGHQAIVCTHPDGHNHSGNIHVHIVINSLRIEAVPLLPYMDRPADTKDGCKHRCTDAAMEYFKSEVMEMCHRENLYQIDLLHGSKNRVTEREYWAQKKGQLALDKENAAREATGQPTKPTKFETDKGKSLIPTKAGINLVTVLPDTLTSPMLTAEWEQKLTAIARGEGDPAAFMAGISDMARELVKTYSHISEEGQKLFAPEREAVGLCPRCGKPVYEGRKNFYCSDRACRFVLWKDDRFWTSRKKELTKKMAGDLLKKGRTSVKGMWSEKKGAAYDAVVVLDDTGEKYVRFKLEFPKRKEGVNGR